MTSYLGGLHRRNYIMADLHMIKYMAFYLAGHFNKKIPASYLINLFFTSLTLTEERGGFCCLLFSQQGTRPSCFPWV